jgi:hypothetical protein
MRLRERKGLAVCSVIIAVGGVWCGNGARGYSLVTSYLPPYIHMRIGRDQGVCVFLAIG